MVNENISIADPRLREIHVSITTEGNVVVEGFDNLDTAISDLEYALSYLYIRRQIALEYKF